MMCSDESNPIAPDPLSTPSPSPSSSPSPSPSIPAVFRIPPEIFIEHILPQLHKVIPSPGSNPLGDISLVCRTFRNYAYQILWRYHETFNKESLLGLLEMSTSPGGKHDLILRSIRHLEFRVSRESGLDLGNKDDDSEEGLAGAQGREASYQKVLDGSGKKVQFSIGNLLSKFIGKAENLSKLEIALHAPWSMDSTLQRAILDGESLTDLSLHRCASLPSSFRFRNKKGSPFKSIILGEGGGVTGDISLHYLPNGALEGIDRAGLEELSFVSSAQETFSGRKIGSDVWQVLEVLELRRDGSLDALQELHPFIQEARAIRGYETPLPLVELHLEDTYAELEVVVNTLSTVSASFPNLQVLSLGTIERPSYELVAELAKLFPNLEELEIFSDASIAGDYDIYVDTPAHFHEWMGGSMDEYAQALSGLKNLKLLSWNHFRESSLWDEREEAEEEDSGERDGENGEDAQEEKEDQGTDRLNDDGSVKEEGRERTGPDEDRGVDGGGDAGKPHEEGDGKGDENEDDGDDDGDDDGEETPKERRAREARWKRAQAQEFAYASEDIKILASACRNLEKVSLTGKWPTHRAYRIRRKDARDGDAEEVSVEELVWEWNYWWELRTPVPVVGRHKVPKSLFLTE